MQQHTCLFSPFCQGLITVISTSWLSYVFSRNFRNSKTTQPAVFRALQLDLFSPLLDALHWLPVHPRIDCKLLSVCSPSLIGAGPQHHAIIIGNSVPFQGFLCILPHWSVSNPFCANWPTFDSISTPDNLEQTPCIILPSLNIKLKLK